jgi:hypothetical protein
MQTTSDTNRQIIDYLDKLSAGDQQRVLSFVQLLSTSQNGIPGKDLVEFFTQHTVSPEEADELARILQQETGNR